MKTELAAKGMAANRYRIKKVMAAWAGLLLLAVTASLAYVLCTLQLRNMTQEILASQRDMQQAWADKAKESVRAWDAALQDQLRFVSTAEMFRLFAVDVAALPPEAVAALDAPTLPKTTMRLWPAWRIRKNI